MAERRKFKRRLLVYNLEVFDSENSEPLGRMVDITPEGMLIVSNKPVPIASNLKISIDLPEELLGTPRANFTAAVRWCRHDINPDLFDSGLEFSEISDGDIESVVALITNYAFPD